MADGRAAAETVEDSGRRQRILLAVCAALMAVVASVSGLNVAQPQVAVELDASQTTVLWIINAYTLTLAALLLPLGAAGDRWGRKPMLLVGLAAFAAANVLGALAPSAEVLLAARVVSGIGAAIIMPITLAVITSTFPEAERAKGIGVWSAVGGGGGMLGMFLSAVLVDLGSWRWLFVLPVTLAAVAFVIALLSVPNTRDVPAHGFDVVGSITSAVGVVGVITALHEGPVHGWTTPLSLTAIISAGIALMIFIPWQLRSRGPLLDLRLFRSPRLSTGSVSLLAAFAVQGGVLIVLLPYFQTVLGWSGLGATLGMMPMAMVMMLAAGLAPRVSAPLGIRSTLLIGIALFAGGLLLLAALVSVDGGYLPVLPGLLVMGVGMGIAMTPATEAITGALPREHQGLASALNDVTRELGAALGIAVLGASLASGYRSAIEPQLADVPAGTAEAAREGVANVIAAAGADADAQGLIRAAQEAFIAGWQQSMWVGVAVMVVLFAFVTASGRRASPRRSAAAPADRPTSAL
ncbi:MFS transporter [Microbacterium sp. CIAB417]|uniref:MFS transporter n=1 Tax=Microbacterium sp. CIAB417 TaxID=2860287 RepID=UPI001FABC9E3|nr:MFS transporter [Microbacterium sp. CIAB417]